MTIETSSETGMEIAVVGLAGRFPGAESVDRFWHNVSHGLGAVKDFSAADLAAAGVPEEDSARAGYVPAGAILDDIDQFDADFFGYSPRDAALLDPQQRVFLECARVALESAGLLTRPDIARVGVYAGTGTPSYLLQNLIGNPDVAGVSEYELTLANDKDTLATRVAYHLDLRGPALSVQTACSSSLVAVHLAAQALLGYECDVALAGGVSIQLPMGAGYRYEKGGILSRDGRCRPFDAAATGTVTGSGAGVVVLRRLADALRDSDQVYAVVKGSAINNDGSVKVGYTAPSPDGQIEVLRLAHQAAEVTPATIGYVETHGAATSLGDQIEFQALTQVFRADTDRTGYCALGAVKALVGHLDTAAGITGFIKACLALHHGVIPPNPHWRQPNPALDFATSPFHMNSGPAPWPELGGPRRAAVSSFGIGGTNAHVVLEQAPPQTVTTHPSARDEHVLTLSAKTPAALAAGRLRLRDHLETNDVPLADVAYTLQTTRQTFDHRLAVVCRSRAEAVELLDTARTGCAPRIDAQVAFLFPGQGTQRVQFGHALYRTEPVFRDAFDTCADLLVPWLGTDLRDLVHPPAQRESEAAEQLRQTWLAQPTLFAVEYALAQLLASRGIRPGAMIGHSIGEYTAACLAGVFPLDDALAVVATRGRLMQELPPGAMLAVHLPAEQVDELLTVDIALAARNGPQLSVLSGDSTAIDRLAARLTERGVTAKRLHTSHAFHSPMMEPALDKFADFVSRVPLRAPMIPVVSDVTGSWLTDEQAVDPHYWARHLRDTVRFSEGVELLLTEPRILLEVGPGRALTTLVRQQTTDRTVIPVVPRPERPQQEGRAFAEALGQLWSAGAPLDWAAGWQHEQRHRLRLPTYAFDRRRHWIDPPGRAADRVPVADSGASSETPGAASLSSIETTIQAIWQELLGIADIGPHDDFFTLGGHSLLGTQVLARIQDTLAVDLEPAAVFDAPTIAELAAQVAARQELADGLPELLADLGAMTPDQLRAALTAELRIAEQEQAR